MKRKLEILKPNSNYPKGIYSIDVDANGMPTDPFLFRRVKEIDQDHNCKWLEKPSNDKQSAPEIKDESDKRTVLPEMPIPPLNPKKTSKIKKEINNA